MTRKDLLTIYRALSHLETAFVICSTTEQKKHFSEAVFWDDVEAAQDLLKQGIEKQDKPDHDDGSSVLGPWEKPECSIRALHSDGSIFYTDALTIELTENGYGWSLPCGTCIKYSDKKITDPEILANWTIHKYFKESQK